MTRAFCPTLKRADAIALQEASETGVAVACSGVLVGGSVAAGEEVAVTSVVVGDSVATAVVGGTAVGATVSVGLADGVVSIAGATVGGITVAGAADGVSWGAAGMTLVAHPRRSIRSRMIPSMTATTVLKRS